MSAYVNRYVEGNVIKGKDKIRLAEALAFFNPIEVDQSKIMLASNLNLNLHLSLQSTLTLVLKPLIFFATDKY